MRISLPLFRRRPAPVARRPRPDQFPTFTPREWADLPVFHPATER